MCLTMHSWRSDWPLAPCDVYSQSELLIGDGCGKARLALMIQHEEYNVFGYTKEAWERQRTMTGN